MHLKTFLASVMGGFAAMTTLVPLQVHAASAGGFIDLVNGYRHDNFSTKINTFDFNKNVVERTKFKVDDVSIYQFGARAEGVFFGFFARGEMLWGWSDHGKFHETSRSFNDGPIKSKGNLSKGRTKNYTIGGGYFFSFCGLEVGPSGGWTYQYQSYRVGHANTQGCPNPCLSGFQYSNRWEGPWAGLDARYDWCDFGLRTGYSYAWAKWKGKWLLHDEMYTGAVFSETCKCNNSRGQTAYVDVLWKAIPSVEIGLGFKWMQWTAKKGREKSKSCNAVYQVWKKEDKVKRALLDSVAVSLLLGVTF